jgi:hypothetical protein
MQINFNSIPNLNNKISHEIILYIRNTINEDLTTKECLDFYNENSSIWNNVTELHNYLKTINNNLKIEEIKSSKTCHELSNGQWLLVG